MTSTVLLFELGTYTSARSPATAGLNTFGRSAAYTSTGGGTGAVVASVVRHGAVVERAVVDDALDDEVRPDTAAIPSNADERRDAGVHRLNCMARPYDCRTLGFGCAPRCGAVRSIGAIALAAALVARPRQMRSMLHG